MAPIVCNGRAVRQLSKSSGEALLIPQALWQQVCRLEGDVGFSLLVRTTKGMEPTKAGERFLSMAADVLERYDTTLAECRALLKSQLLEPALLRVPMTGGIALSPFWQHMYQELPYQRSDGAERPLCLEFVTEKHVGTGLIPELLDGTYDLIEHHSIAGEHPDSVYYEELEKDESSIVVGINDPLAALAAARVEDLRGHELSAFTPAFFSGSGAPARVQRRSHRDPPDTLRPVRHHLGMRQRAGLPR